MDKNIAEFFYQQLAGSTNGHMAEIPNNPVIYSLLYSYEAINSREEFARFLFDIATYLGDNSARKIEEDAIERAAIQIRNYIEIDNEGEKIGAERAESVVKHGTPRSW